MDMVTTNKTDLRALRRAWNRAWRRLKSLKPAARAILDALFLRLGNDIFCRPSQSTIAQDSGLSERTVQRWLPILEQQGWIRREERVCARGRLTDRYHIRTPDHPDITTLKVDQEPTRQNGRGCPDKMAQGKGTIEKATETSSVAAGAAAPGQSKKEKRSGQARLPTPPEHIAQFKSLWRELVGQGPQPDPKWLDTYSPREVQTALAVLLTRMGTSQVRSPLGLYKRLLVATHAGEREPRPYSTDQLRRIAAGVLPEHTRKVRQQPTPEVPDEVQPPQMQTQMQPPQTQEGTSQGDLPVPLSPPNPAQAMVSGCSPSGWQEVCALLSKAITAGQIHALDAIDALTKVWGWSPRQAQQALAGGAS